MSDMSRATSTIPVTHTTRYSAVHFAHFLSTTLFDWSRSIRSMMSATASVTYGHHADAKMATPLANTEYGGGGGGSPLSGLGRHEGVLHIRSYGRTVLRRSSTRFCPHTASISATVPPV